MQLATGTGIAPFRSFLWKMFFEKHEDYKVKHKFCFPWKLFWHEIYLRPIQKSFLSHEQCNKVNNQPAAFSLSKPEYNIHNESLFVHKLSHSSSE